ncbi:MAG: hypothetical protein U9O94_04725 [Nanoarchaeota archaeon]|nr:hypothetical protein [Nanoarchaeota archaeon]
MTPGLIYAWNFVQLEYQLALTSANRLLYKYALDKSSNKRNVPAYATT